MLMVMAQSEVINLVDHTVFQTKKSMVQYNCIPPLPAFRLWFPGFWFDLPLKLDIRCLSTTFFLPPHIRFGWIAETLCYIFYTCIYSCLVVVETLGDILWIRISLVVFSVVWLSATEWAYGCPWPRDSSSVPRIDNSIWLVKLSKSKHPCAAERGHGEAVFMARNRLPDRLPLWKSARKGKHTKWQKMPQDPISDMKSATQSLCFCQMEVFVELEVRGASYAVSCWSNRRLNCFLAFWRPNQDHQLHYVLSPDQQTPKNVTRPVFRVAIFQDHRLRGALEKDLLWKPVRD